MSKVINKSDDYNTGTTIFIFKSNRIRIDFVLTKSYEKIHNFKNRRL